MQRAQAGQEGSGDLQSSQDPHPPPEEIQEQGSVQKVEERKQGDLPRNTGHEPLPHRQSPHLFLQLTGSRKGNTNCPQIQRRFRYYLQLAALILALRGQQPLRRPGWRPLHCLRKEQRRVVRFQRQLSAASLALGNPRQQCVYALLQEEGEVIEYIHTNIDNALARMG